MAEEPTTDAPTSASGGDDEAGTAAAGAASSDAPRAAEDIEKELEELRGSLDGKDGSEKEELEEKIKNLETELDSVKEAAAPTTATDGDEQGSQTNVAGNETDAEGGQEAATDNLASESDDKPADGEGTKETADGDDTGKEDSVEPSGNKTEAKTDQDEDSPEKEVEIKLEKTEEGDQTKESAASSAAGGRKSGRSVSRTASRISQRSTSSSKPPTRSGKRRGSRRSSESPDVLKDIPQLRKRGEAPPTSIPPVAEVGEGSTHQITGTADPLERLVGPIFRSADVNNDKVLSLDEILRMFRSPELGLHLSKEDLVTIKGGLGLTDSSQLTYRQFIPLAQQVLMRVYQQQDPDSMDEWMELFTGEGDTIWFNRFTGEASFGIPEGYAGAGAGDNNLIEDVIREIFSKADVDNTGLLSQDEFVNMLQSNELGLFLSEEEILQIAGHFDTDQDGQITYEEFVPLAKKLIMTLYQRRDPSPNEWVHLNSRQAGLFWFNKRTGETRRQQPAEVGLQERAEEQERQQELLFVQNALSDLEGAQYELQVERQQRGEVEYQLQAVEEESEAAKIQLEETGRRLDLANLELRDRETAIKDKDTLIEQGKTKVQELQDEVAALLVVKTELEETQEQLKDSRAESEEKAGVISNQDATIASLREQISKLTVELRMKTAIEHEQNATIEDLTERLANEEARNRHLEQELMQMPVLEGELQKTETVLLQTQKHLDEKASALTVTRKNLRSVKDKNSELESGLSVVSELRDKLHAARCEVHTLRQFVGGKTALVLARERELDTAKQRMKEMEEKDSRRAQVLASVLEKTARLQQDTRGKTSTEGNFKMDSSGDQPIGADRPLSCPALLPLNADYDDDQAFGTGYNESEEHGARTIGASSAYTRSLVTRGTHGLRSPTKLPPVSRVSRRPDTWAAPKNFHPITPADVKTGQRVNDAKLTAPLFPANLEPGRTLKSIPISYALPEDGEAAADAVAAEQVKVGDRVLVRRKRMPWESEASKSSGIVRYVGRIDSEYVDNRLYVGLQLDNPDGEHDGVVKGKRYFKCAPRRGLLVRITEVITFLPKNDMAYRPLMANDMAISA